MYSIRVPVGFGPPGRSEQQRADEAQIDQGHETGVPSALLHLQGSLVSRGQRDFYWTAHMSSDAPVELHATILLAH